MALEDKVKAAEEKAIEAREYRINAVEVKITLGVWRGPKCVNQLSPDRPLLVLAKDDEEPLPYGRALEELLEELLTKTAAV